jgi:hypothetical protein
MSQPRRPDPEQLGPAIAILTAWANSGDDLGSVGAVTANYVADGLPEPDLVVGLINLAGLLLIRLERATGTPAPELLTDLARRYMT